MALKALRFDVYGRLDVHLRNAGGEWWIAETIGNDGKRRRLPDLVIPLDASSSEVVDLLEAAYHEWASPGATIKSID